MNFNLNFTLDKVMEQFAKHKSLRVMFYSVVLVALIFAVAQFIEAVRWW